MSLFKKIFVFGKKAQTKNFLSWEDYTERLSYWDLLSWQQETRRMSLRNLMAQEQK